MNFHFTAKSSNTKTGAIPVTVSSAQTCPPVCPFINDGCYAKAGFYTRLHWDKVSSGARGASWQELIDQITAIPAGAVWRHNIAGDLPGEGNAIDAQALEQLTAANQSKSGFTYTHKPVLGEAYDANQDAVRKANAGGFAVNLSANTLAEADALAALAIAPVAVVLNSAQTNNTVTPSGRKVVVCPATQRDDVTCESCRLCARINRTVIVGFPAHGSGARKVNRIIAIKSI
jgi:hypothetical protein